MTTYQEKSQPSCNFVALKPLTDTTMSAEEGTAIVSEVMKPSTPTPPVTPAAVRPVTPVVSRPNKRKSKKFKNDPLRFQGSGVNFNGKFIGFDEIAEARGDKLCQEKIQRLKALKRSSGEHKQRININVSLEGIKVIDQKTGVVEYTHPVHKVSFISRDTMDSRAFGYVYSEADNSHNFFAIKTEKAADQLVLTLRDLFQVVYELKKDEVDEIKKHEDDDKTTETASVPNAEEPKPEEQEAVPPSGQEASPHMEEEKTANLLDLENELHTIEQGIEQMNTLENMFNNVEDRSSTDSPLLNVNVNPWGSAPQPTGPGLGSAQAPPQSNPWPSTAVESSGLFQPTGMGVKNVAVTDPLASLGTSTGSSNTAFSDVFSSPGKTNAKAGSNITADMFSDIETGGTSSSVFGVTASPANPGMDSGLSSATTGSKITADLFSGIESGTSSSLFGVSSMPPSTNVSNDFSSKQQTPSVGIAGQIDAFATPNMSQTQSVNLSNPFGGNNTVLGQNQGLSSTSQSWGNTGNEFQQQAAGLTSLDTLNSRKEVGQTPLTALGKQVDFAQPSFQPKFNQSSGFTNMPSGMEFTTAQMPMSATSSQPFQQVPGSGISAGSQFRSSPIPGISVAPPISSVQTQNMASNPTAHNPFQSAQPTVQAGTNFSNQPVIPPSPFNPSVSSQSFPLDSMKMQGGNINSTLPLRQSVSLPVTKDPFADDPFSSLQSSQPAGGSLFSSNPVSSGPSMFPVHSSGPSVLGSENPFGLPPTPSPSRVDQNDGFNANRASLNNSPDPFSDLCILGKKEPVEKPVKDMFAEKQPKRTLNEMRTNSPMTVTVQQQQASGDPFSTPHHQHNFPSNDHTLPFSQNSDAAFRPNLIPVNNDPWAVFDETISVKKKKLKENSPSTFSASSSDFNLPSPDEPPPPLPSHIQIVSDVPAPPPRPIASTPNQLSNPSPAPLHTKSHSCSPSQNRLDRTVQIISVPRPFRNKVTNADSARLPLSRCHTSTTESRTKQNESPVQENNGRFSEVHNPLHITDASKPSYSFIDTFAPAGLSILNNKSLQNTQSETAVCNSAMSVAHKPASDFADIFGATVTNGD